MIAFQLMPTFFSSWYELKMKRHNSLENCISDHSIKKFHCYMTHLENKLGCTFSNKSHQVAKCQSKEDLIKMFDVLMEFYEKDKPNHDCAYAQCSKTYWMANKIVDFTNDLAETMVGLSEKKDHVILGFGMFSEKVEIVEEFYIYQFSNFVADVGGSLGLFLGVSLLSIVQWLHQKVLERSSRQTVEVT